jgi:hypothetical protein
MSSNIERCVARAVARCGCAPGENKILRPHQKVFFLHGGGGGANEICGKMRPSSLHLRPSLTCAPGDHPLRPALATALCVAHQSVLFI